jgi:hypothetical protein
MASEGWNIIDAQRSTKMAAVFYCRTNCSASSNDDSRIQTQTDAIAYLWEGYDDGPIILSDLSGIPEKT